MGVTLSKGGGTPALPFDNTYARLPDRFFARALPTPVAAPRLVKVNRALADLLSVDADELASPAGVEVLSGNVVPEGAEPIALAYAGHQFGSFVPRLGDGRAILLGEIVGTDGRRRDVQLKGAGRTPFSRGGDGRAALGPVLREYLVSEAMAALGIPTTRALAFVTTGEPVYREQALPGAVLTRVAASHIRVGTFEYFAAQDDHEALEELTRYVIARHYPEAQAEESPALALIDRVVSAQATLVAQWLGVGFVHGVMNTDNCSVAGETIDYGPCAFLDTFDPGRRFSSIDRTGRYAFMSQPRIAQWNVTRLAEAILPLLGEDEDLAAKAAVERLERFPAKFSAEHARVMRAKLGLTTERDDDLPLALDLLGRLADGKVDYTIFFRRLCDAAEHTEADSKLAALFETPGAFHEWAERWRRRLDDESVTPAARASGMRRANPAFIPRNHRVEEAIEAATERADFQPFEALHRVLARPYDDQPEASHLQEAPGPEQHAYKTFCGT